MFVLAGLFTSHLLCDVLRKVTSIKPHSEGSLVHTQLQESGKEQNAVLPESSVCGTYEIPSH